MAVLSVEVHIKVSKNDAFHVFSFRVLSLSEVNEVKFDIYF